MPVVAGICVAVFGAVTFFGYVLQIPALRAEFSGVEAITASETWFFLWSGLALALLADGIVSRRRLMLGLVCASVAAIWALLHLIEFVVAAAFGLDDAVFRELASLTGIPFAGCPNVWDLVLVSLLSASLFFIHSRRANWLGELFVLVPVSVTFLAVVGEAFRLIPTKTPAADSFLPGVIAYSLLELGLLLGRPDRVWVSTLVSPGLGGALARRLLPLAVLVPFGAAWVRLAAEQAGYIGKEVGAGLYALLIVFVQATLIMWYAAAVNRSDKKRVAAEEFLRSLLRTGDRLNSRLDVDSLLSILVAEATHLVGAESGVAGIRTAEGTMCRKYRSSGLPDSQHDDEYAAEGPPARVVLHKVPYRCNDVSFDSALAEKLFSSLGVRSALVAPILDSGGVVLGAVEVHNKPGGFSDADEERLIALAQSAASSIQNALAYHDLRKAEQALKAADRHKDAFLATLAHELRNPLAPIRSGLEILKHSKREGATREQVREMMERQLQLMTRLIDDLLDVSRIGQGKIDLRIAPTLLEQVIQSAVDSARPMMSEARHKLQVDLPDEPVWIRVDGSRIAQVISNLLVNAAKYTPRGGKISLAASAEDDELLIEVVDNGIGIAEEMRERIFEMFAQVDQTLEKSKSGLGIGLTLAKSLIEMHCGRIWVESEGIGRGSTFRVRLPVIDSWSSNPSSSPSADTDVEPLDGHRVLVADDHKDGAQMLAEILRLLGNDVALAFDGEEAVERAREFRPDVILMDIGMPKLNGYDAARRIREESWGQDLHLIALTGWGQESDIARSKDAGFDQHLVKPVEPSTLKQALANLSPASAGATNGWDVN